MPQLDRDTLSLGQPGQPSCPFPRCLACERGLLGPRGRVRRIAGSLDGVVRWLLVPCPIARDVAHDRGEPGTRLERAEALAVVALDGAPCPDERVLRHVAGVVG